MNFPLLTFQFRFPTYKRTPLAFVCAGAACCVLASSTVTAKPKVDIAPAYDGNRGPFAIAFTPDGSLAVVTEFDEGAVAVIDRTSGRVLRHISTGGTEPTGIAITRDGSRAIVTNSLSGSVAFINLANSKCDILPLRGAPWGAVVSPDSRTVYVTVSQLDQVAVIDISSKKIVGSMPTGRRPRAIVMSPDGGTLVTANMTAGSVSYLDTATMTQRGQGATPAVNLRGVALFPDGRTVFAVGQRAQNERPTKTAIGIWSNQAFLQVANGPRNGLQNLWLDLMGKDVSDPDSVVLEPRTRRAFITCSGGHSLNVVPYGDDGDTVTVQNVGVHPRGLTFTPDGKELWIANMLGNDIAVVDPVSLKIKRRVNLGPTDHKDPNLRGRFLFTTATIVKGEQFSCNSCHPDGGTDGISWKFVHVPDGLGENIDRNVKGLRGHIGKQSPYRWSGHEPSIEKFIAEEIPGLLQGAKPSELDIKAIAAYVDSLPLAPNPYREENGSLTEAGRRGKALFEGKAACIQCHSGQNHGGGRQAWVGTTPQGVHLLVPRLTGVYDTDPYLHNGKARTLEEVFLLQNQNNLHGKAHELSSTEMKDLLRYVREL